MYDMILTSYPFLSWKRDEVGMHEWLRTTLLFALYVDQFPFNQFLLCTFTYCTDWFLYMRRLIQLFNYSTWEKPRKQFVVRKSGVKSSPLVNTQYINVSSSSPLSHSLLKSIGIWQAQTRQRPPTRAKRGSSIIGTWTEWHKGFVTMRWWSSTKRVLSNILFLLSLNIWYSLWWLRKIRLFLIEQHYTSKSI